MLILRARILLPAALLAAAAAAPPGQSPAGPAPRAAAPTPAAAAAQALLSLPSVQAALADAESRLPAFAAEWVRLAEIPAPSGGEAQRAGYMESRFRKLGLASVGRDAAGNVLGLMKGKDPSLRRVVFAAHMDTVAPAEADHRVTRTAGPVGEVLRAPGIRDDTAGLAALLAAISLMRAHDLRPEADTWFVATVKEEVGLKGAGQFVEDHAAELGAFIAVDGQLGQISYGASGIVWLKLRFTGEAAHTLRAHEKPSAILAAARAIDAISAIPLRRSPEPMESWLNIGAMGAGDVPNALPREAWFTVDLRSNDPESARLLEQKVVDEARRAARGVGVKLDVETIQRLAGGTPPGADQSPLVVCARQVLQSLAWDAIQPTPRGTADHNVALARDIPGIAIGITTGDGAHTPDEYADVAPFALGVKQVLLLALMPLTPAAP